MGWLWYHLSRSHYPLPKKAGLMGCVAPPFISSGPSHHFSDVGLLSMTLSPTQSCDALVTDGAPCLPYPSERLARHQSWVWVVSDTTRHGAITFSLKGRFDGVCRATIYKPRTLPSLVWCGTLIRDPGREVGVEKTRTNSVFSTKYP